MFGVWRLLLALCVAAFHLLHVPVIGEYAVFSFFVLSGFLMTTVMHESYGYDADGRRRYAINRFLRLYPSYWVAATLSLAVILACGQIFVKSYDNEIYVPNNISAIISNVTMIFPRVLPYSITPRLSPPTWALTVEITYYVAIGLGVSKTRWRSLFWLAASVAYVVETLVLHLDRQFRYSAIPAGSLPFALGSCLYFYKDAVHRLIEKAPLNLFTLAAANVAMLGGFAIAGRLGHGRIVEAGLYIDLAAASLLLVRLYFDGVPGLPRRLDKLIGDYSYPIYLLHWPLGALSSYILFHRPEIGASRASLAVFGLDLVLVFAASTVIIFVIDPSIERLRTRIRERRRSSEASDRYAKATP